MRPLLAVCLLVGCYKPSTDSCYYACATEGAPCPSGLSCVAGMCAAPGDDCSATGDGGIDSSGRIDAAGTACGDGTATIGEVCFGTPIMITPPGSPRAGQLADRDGDNDLDLIYIDDASFRFHLNTGGVLATTSVAGPMLNGPGAMITANLNTTAGAELIVATNVDFVAYTAAGSAPHTQLFVHPLSGFGGNTALAHGRISDTGMGDFAITAGSQFFVYRLDASTSLTQAASRQIPGGYDVAVGRFNADNLDDIVVGTDSGALVFYSTGVGIDGPFPFGPSTRVDSIEVGDFDGDGKRDIAFVTVDPVQVTGTLGIMKGRGDGMFNAPVNQTITSLGTPLAVSDIDRDGRDDVIAFLSGPSPAVMILRGKTDGSLEQPIKLMVTTGTASHVSARGDFNGDMVPDIVLTDFMGRRLFVIPSDP